jgi:F0F1-type ATP synthase assembly protein I
VVLVKTFTSSPAVSGGPASVLADRIARLMPPPGRSDWSGFGTGWAATGTLLAGILTWGGIGWLVDRLLDTGRLFLAIGLVVGAAGGIYLVYLRYGKTDD